MAKLIYNNPVGLQVCQEVGPGGGCADKSMEVWNEVVDGPISEKMLAKLGGLKRVKSGLIVDERMLAAQEAKLAEIRAAEEKAAQERNERLAAIASVDVVTTTEELKTVTKALIKEFGYKSPIHTDSAMKATSYSDVTTVTMSGTLAITLYVALAVGVALNIAATLVIIFR